MFINSISASKSDVIDQCLWKYYLKYVLRITGFGNKNEESLNFGSYIHKIFELGYTSTNIKDLRKLSEELKPTYHIPFNLENRTSKCLENFLRWNNTIGETVSTEFTFELVIDAAHDIKFKGVVDRIVKGKDGGYLVIDYKTSKREKKVKDLLTDKQLQGYAFAIHKLYDVDFNNIWCAHYYPESNTLVSVKFSRLQIYQWLKKETDKVWRIRKKTKDSFYPMKNIFCDYCEYQPGCNKFHPQDLVDKRIAEQVEKKKLLDEEKLAREQSLIEAEKTKP